MHRQLAEDERKQAATKATMQQEMNRVRAQNEAWIEAKRAAAAKVKEEDKALMRETMRTLEKQEADRLQAMKDFHVRHPRKEVSVDCASMTCSPVLALGSGQEHNVPCRT